MLDPIQSKKDVLSQLRLQLESLSEAQEKLADAREELLLERERFRSRGKILFAHRRKTRQAEVEFMNRCREFFNEQGSTFPPALQAAYESVHTEHDKLGAMASDYLQAEEDLGANEWAFTERENGFYQFDLQDLISDDFLESTPPSEEEEPQPQPSPGTPDIEEGHEELRYQAAVTDYDCLVKRFDALRQEKAIKLDLFGQSKPQLPEGAHYSDFQDLSFHLLTQIADCEVKIHHLRDDQILHQQPIILRDRQRPVDATQPSTMAPSHLGTAAPPLSNSPLPVSLHSLSPNGRIRRWLWDRLRYSAFERDVYLNTLIQKLEQSGILGYNYLSWEDDARKYWNMSDQVSPTDKFDPAATFLSRERQNADIGSTQPRDGDEEISLPAVKLNLNFDANVGGPAEPEQVPGLLNAYACEMQRADSCQPPNTAEEWLRGINLSEPTVELAGVSSAPDVGEQAGPKNIYQETQEATNTPLVVCNHTGTGACPGVLVTTGMDEIRKTGGLQSKLRTTSSNVALINTISWIYTTRRKTP